jgi:hypothetical protein
MNTATNQSDVLRVVRDTKWISPEHKPEALWYDVFCSVLTELIQLMRLLLYGDEVEILRTNYKKRW